MKTYLLYGFISSLAGAFLTLILYFAGFHSDPAKLAMAGWIGGLLGLAIIVTCITLGVKARREEVPPDQDFSYWSSFFAAFMISMISNLFSLGFTVIYNVYVNPTFLELMRQQQITKMENNGMSSDKAESASAMMFGVVPQAVIFIIFGTIIAVVLSFIMAGFFTRKAVQPPKI
jgi:hypothetical protein